MLLRTVLVLLSLLAPFFVPWPFAVVLGLIASYFVPPVAVVLGVMFEVLYGVGGVPYAALAGAIACALLYGVRRFVKARIMEA